MNCPNCKYDMFYIYERILDGKKSKYCKITNMTSYSQAQENGTDWEVECVCPKCEKQFTFFDGDY